jgi:pimeloyl-ACP methyl ester carboxylesterase
MNPDHVAALVMEDVGAVRPQSIAQGYTDRLAAGDQEFDSVEEWVQENRGPNTRASIELTRHLWTYNTKQLPNGKFGLKRDPMIQMDMRPLELWHYVEEVEAPLLLVLGSESTIVGQDQKDRFLEIRPDVEIITIPEAGHIVVHDQPDEFERTIREFLTRHGI